MKVDFACEHNDVPCREYRVTDHDGNMTRCVYCSDCAALAAIDWNGETADIADMLGGIERNGDALAR